uniref:Protein rolling stone n=1 Tax=Mesocestoides corti TaxID=53468 RepID=A0A5K3EQT0_MESCO
MQDATEERKPCCSTFGKALKSEFKCSKFGFTGAIFSLFPLPQWIWMDGVVYTIYRVIIALGLVIWACVEIPLEVKRSKEEHMKLYYFLYATNWAFLTYTVTSSIFAVYCAYFNFNKEKHVPKCFSEFLWFLYGMSMNTVLVTSLVYWAAFWDPKYVQFYRPESKFKHLIPACTVFIDAWVNGLPIRLLHAIYPTLLGLIYAVFSYIYYDAGNIRPIYPVLDWSKPADAVIASVLTITFGLVIQVFLYVIFFIRIVLSYRLGGRGELVSQWWKENGAEDPSGT